MTNEELVRRYYGGDERALEELYRRNLGLIRRIARETARRVQLSAYGQGKTGRVVRLYENDSGGSLRRGCVGISDTGPEQRIR